MSELKKNRFENRFRWNLLCSVSALALAASPAMAADSATDHPLLWITFGGDLDALGGTNAPFKPHFTLQSPTPDPFKGGASPIGLQRPPRFTYGEEASITFQPEDSDWVFSAGIRYGRSNNKRDVHRQTKLTYSIYDILYRYNTPSKYTQFPRYLSKTSAAFGQTTVAQSERHMILDFQAGKDVGLGMFGNDGTSQVSAGVRMARFQTHSDVTMRARLDFVPYTIKFEGLVPAPYFQFNTYYQHGVADRSFHGVGPSLSWKASAPFAGDEHDGELSLDWSVNGAILFGKQRANVSHSTAKRHYKPKYQFSAPTVNNPYHTTNYETIYDRGPNPRPPTRSRSVTVPNLGASIGVSYRVQDFKLSLGYRADYFFGAMDGGIDKAKKKTLGFNGLYASISIGLGD